MLFIVESVKTYLIPGSVEFLVVGLIVAVLLLHGRGRASRLGRVLLMTLTITYLLLSLPLGPSVLVWGLTRGATPIPTQRAAEGATAVVVLSGGSGTYSAQGRAIELISGTSALRVLETARIYHMLSDPLVITTGGITAPNRQTKPGATLLKNVLTPLGVPASRIIPETKSLNQPRTRSLRRTHSARARSRAFRPRDLAHSHQQSGENLRSARSPTGPVDLTNQDRHRAIAWGVVAET